MSKGKGLTCPHCNKPCGFGEQMQDWEENYGEDVSTEEDHGWAMINVFCKNCNHMAWTVDLSGVESEVETEIKSGPMKGKKLVMPSFVKPKRKN